MPFPSGLRALLALAVVALAAFAGLLLNGDVQASLVVLVCGIAAVLIAAGSGEEAPAPPAAPPAPAPEPRIGEVIEAIAEPVLVIRGNRVESANRAAQALLGHHILGEDVRLAIRHPAAAERLLNPGEAIPGAPVHLVGLGTRDQRWEMRVRTIGDRRIVHLIDRTGSYTSERIPRRFRRQRQPRAAHPARLAARLCRDLGGGGGRGSGDAQALPQDHVRRSQANAAADRGPDLAQPDRGRQISRARPVGRSRRADRGGPFRDIAGTSERAGDLRVEVADASSVRGDRAQLSQLLHNIVGNAMKYGREGTPVTIALRRESEAMVRLSVSDEGEGIPPTHIPRLTERFYRVDSGRSRAMGGTGLGLAIVKHVVERHRGRLDIASVVGKGTTVTILLPSQTVIKR